MTYVMTKLTQHKWLLAVLATMVLGFVMAGPALGQEDDPLGVDAFEGQSNLGTNSLEETVGGIINVGLSLLSIVAVVIVIMGGVKWMTAGGDDDKVKEARTLIIQGIIGLAVILSAWAIANYVLRNLAVQTGVQGSEGYSDAP